MKNYFLLEALILTLFQYSIIFSQFIPPKSLENIEVLYSSPFEISSEKPIITSKNIFFVENNQIKSIDLEKILFGEKFDINSLWQSYKNPLAYSIKNDNLQLFVSYENKLEIWENDNKKFDNIPIYQKTFEQFKSDKPNDSLNIDIYHHKQKNNYEIAIYNKQENKVIVLDILKIDKTILKETIAAEFDLENNIAQSFIYHFTDIDKADKTKLMIVDQKGNIKIWSIGTFIEHFSRSYYRYINPLSNSFQINEECPELLYNQDISGFIGEKKDIILYMGKKNFTTIHLRRGYYYLELFRIPNPINNALTILTLDNGDFLVGTKEGYIYLVEYLYENKKKIINILDKYNICEGSPVKHIVYDNNCPKSSEKCYIFIANCGHLKVFRIGAHRNIIIKYRKSISYILIVGFILFLIFIYKKNKNSPKDKNEEEIELTEK